MRSNTFVYPNTVVTIAHASARVNLEALREMPQIKQLIELGLDAASGHYFCTDEAKFHHSVVLTVVHSKNVDELVIYATGIRNDMTTGTYRVENAAGAVMFVAIEETCDYGDSVRAVITIEDRKAVVFTVTAQQGNASATLIDDEVPSEEDDSVGTWIPSIDMLVKIKQEYSGRNDSEVYILKDIDIYECAFILVNADSARRERDVQYNVQHVGMNRTRVYNQEINLKPHGKDGIKVPFEAVEPFQLNL